jgi:threonine aldolase
MLLGSASRTSKLKPSTGSTTEECPPLRDDAAARAVGERFNHAFEAEVGLMLVSTGTASNALALASVCPP